MGDHPYIKRVRGRNSEKKCANCIVCKQDTDLCPLNENYDPDAYLRWEAKYLARRKESKRD